MFTTLKKKFRKPAYCINEHSTRFYIQIELKLECKFHEDKNSCQLTYWKAQDKDRH